MCVVSMIGDHYGDRFKPWRERINPFTQPYYPDPYQPSPISVPAVTKAEFDELKKEVENMKALLQRAIKYDEDNGEPDCHKDEKVEFLKKVAEFVGVSLEDVFKEKK